MNFSPYAPDDEAAFTAMFDAYFAVDFGLQLEPEQLGKIVGVITSAALSGVSPLDILRDGGNAVGFVIYQVDSPASDWNEREGWGFIRETYVSPTRRGQGLGRQLAQHAETELAALGCTQIYLTSDATGTFWEACGYAADGTVASKNGDPIYTKDVASLA